MQTRAHRLRDKKKKKFESVQSHQRSVRPKHLQEVADELTRFLLPLLDKVDALLLYPLHKLFTLLLHVPYLLLHFVNMLLKVVLLFLQIKDVFIYMTSQMTSELQGSILSSIVYVEFHTFSPCQGFFRVLRFPLT